MKNGGNSDNPTTTDNTDTTNNNSSSNNNIMSSIYNITNHFNDLDSMKNDVMVNFWLSEENNNGSSTSNSILFDN